MDHDKSQFLFGVDLPPFDLADHDRLIEYFTTAWAEHDNPFFIAPALLAGSAKLIIDGEPSSWETAVRLTESGLSRHVALEQIAFAIRYEVQRTTPAEGERPANPEFDAKRLGMLFDSLPLADDEQLFDSIAVTLESGEARDVGSLVEAVLADLELPSDAELIANQVHRSIEAGSDTGVLRYLPGDLLVHVPTVTRGIVLTHRLHREEIDRDTLMCVGDDLAGFELYETLHFADPGDDGAFGIIVLDAEDAAWKLPERTLAHFGDGDLVAVRVDDAGGVTIERIDEPSADLALVEVFVAVYGREIEEIDMAVRMSELLVAVLVAERKAFTKPQVPLTELCQLAGLGVRDGHVGRSDESWTEFRRSQRFGRLYTAADGHDHCAGEAAEVLAIFDDSLEDDAAIREALHSLHDDHVAQLVVDELIDPDGTGHDHDRDQIRRIGDRLVAVATRGPDVAAAHLMKGVIIERSGDPVEAERCFVAGQAAQLGSAQLLDRLAWYASDRGDAKAAIRLWQMLEDDHGEAAAIEAYARSAHSAVGRNDPCWCGSGRKFKTCHQGVIEQAPLPDRVGWIMHKAFGYLRRHGGTTVASVIGAAAAWAGDDLGSISRALDDPIVFDTVLTEGGWMARFVADRGPLLPADEAALVKSWLPIPRSVYEFEDVIPGGNVDARDLRTGQRVSVRAHSKATQKLSGGTMLARAVPDGEGHQFIGAVHVIPDEQREEALALCAVGDGDAICAYVGAFRRRPRGS